MKNQRYIIILVLIGVLIFVNIPMKEPNLFGNLTNITNMTNITTEYILTHFNGTPMFGQLNDTTDINESVFDVSLPPFDQWGPIIWPERPLWGWVFIALVTLIILYPIAIRAKRYIEVKFHSDY